MRLNSRVNSSMVNWLRSLQALFWLANIPGRHTASFSGTVSIQRIGTMYSAVSAPSSVC